MTSSPHIASGRRALVLGATGQQGGAVARVLVNKGWSVRAMVRDPSSARASALVTDGVETMKGDLGNLGSLTAAMQGVVSVFSVLPSSGQPGSGVTDADEVSAGVAVADCAVASGVQHLVYSSSNAAGAPTGVGHFDSKSRVEEHVRQLPIATTIVRPSTFMEMLLEPTFGAAHGILTFFMRPDQAMQFVAVSDIGHLVTAILAKPAAYAGRTIELAGDNVTGHELAEILDVTYRRFPEDALRANPLLARLCALVDDGRLAGLADLDELRRIHPALLTMRDWARDQMSSTAHD